MADAATVVAPTKRRNPFGERQLAGLPAADAVSAAEATQAMLIEAQKNLVPLPPPASPELGECFMCRHYDVIVQCEFCERKTCELHTKLCHQCTGVFCACCSTVDYEVRYSDSAICLTCEEERRRADIVNGRNCRPGHPNQMRTGGHQNGSALPTFQSAAFGSQQSSVGGHPQ